MEMPLRIMTSPKDYGDLIGFRQVIFIEVYIVKRFINYNDYSCWLLGEKCGVCCCEQVAPLVLSADQFSEPIRFKQSQIQWLDWLMGFGSDSDWLNHRIPVSNWLILLIKSGCYSTWGCYLFYIYSVLQNSLYIYDYSKRESYHTKSNIVKIL